MPATKTSRGSPEYEIVSTFQPPRRSKGAPDDRGTVSRLEPPGNGTKVTVIGHRMENVGALSLPSGTWNDGRLEWDAVAKSSPAAWERVQSLPDRGQPATIRLRYVVRFVEHDDPLKALVDLDQRDPETTKQVKRFYDPQVPADRKEMN